MELEALALVGIFGKSLLFALAAILPIINPLASAPIYVSLTHHLDSSTRLMLAKRIGQHVTLLLVGATLVGSYVLSVFGISLPVVRVAGGLVVASMAWRLLNAQQMSDADPDQLAQSVNESDVRVRAFYPLTFPLSCGPGTIAVAITIGASLHTPRVTESLVTFSAGVLAMVITGALVALTFRYANRLLHLLGDVGQIIFMRLMAFLLLSIGVQIMWDGVGALLRTL